MTYDEKKKIADDYLWKEYSASWDGLADTNDLHDCETKEEIEDAAQERYLEDSIT